MARRALTAIVGACTVLAAVAAGPPTAPAGADDLDGCTRTWQGDEAGAWHDADAWSPAGAPGATDVACIDGGVEVTITGPTTIRGLRLGIADADPEDRPRLVVDGTSLTLTEGTSTNHGTLALTSSSPTGTDLVVATGAALTSSGTLDLAAGAGGQRRVRGGDVTSTGTIAVGGAAWLGGNADGPARLASSGPLTVAPGASLQVASAGQGATLAVVGGTATLDGPVSGLGATARFELAGDARLAGAVVPTWAGGTVAVGGTAVGRVRSTSLTTALAGTVPAGVVLEAAHPTAASGWRVPAGTEVVNHGTIRLGAPDVEDRTRRLDVEAGAALVNAGVLEWPATGGANRTLLGEGQVRNEGVVRIDAPLRWGLAGGVTSTGAVTVAPGVEIDAADTPVTLTAGTVDLADGARLRHSGTRPLELGGTVAVTGPGTVDARGALGFSGSPAATVVVGAGEGRLLSDVPTSATLVVEGRAPGTVTRLLVDPDRRIDGTLRLAAADQTAAQVVLDGDLTVAGRLEVPGLGTPAGNGLLDGPGTVHLAGTAELSASLERRGGPTEVTGDLHIGPTASLETDHLTVAGGTTSLAGALATTELDLLGGRVEGHGTITGTVAHDGGTLAPTDGRLVIAGAYAQGAAGRLSVAATDDVADLEVGGPARLGGPLHVRVASPGLTGEDRPLVHATLLEGDPTTVEGVPAAWVRQDGRLGTVLLRPVARFPDVAVGHPFLVEIELVAAAGLLGGDADGRFGPGRTATRQAVVALLWRAAGQPTATGSPTFPDVGPEHPFAPAITWAATTGLVTGRPDGTFDGTAPLTRQALAAVVARAGSAAGSG